MGVISGRVAVIKFCHGAAAKRAHKVQERPCAFRDSCGKEHFFACAKFGPLNDMSDAVEIDVGARDCHDQITVRGVAVFDMGNHASQSERAGGFNHGAGGFKYIFDRRAYFVIGHG